MILDYEPSINDVSSEGREKNSLKRQFTTLLNEVSRGGTGGGHVCLFQGWDRGTAKCIRDRSIFSEVNPKYDI